MTEMWARRLAGSPKSSPSFLSPRTIGLLFGLALSLGLPPGPLGSSLAWATTLLRLSLDELVEASTVVAQVEVLEVEVVEGAGQLETRATMRIDRALRGAPRGSVVVVAIPGGEVEGWGQRVVGAPEVREGDSALVFLERAGGGRFAFVGLEQGFLKIVDGESGPEVVQGSEARHVIRDSEGNIVEAPTRPSREPLLPLLERVRLLVNDGKNAP